ncbi:toprim domain-containing protein [Flavobacterium sp.]|uniref:DUF7146 domain-containing protein n=1 Tax=Flavobacterium sp. TaxID=239 RepID=UPI00262EA918|nr:toprim domain-containing protein [Flavobacterium sp.]
MKKQIDWNGIFRDRNMLPSIMFVNENVHVNCPFCGRKKFRLWPKAGNGNWICVCGTGRGLDLYSKLSGESVSEVLKQVRQGSFAAFSSGIHMAEPVIRTLTKEEIEKNAAKLSLMAKSSKHISPSDPVWRYLESRVCFLDVSQLCLKDVRFHPRLAHLHVNEESEKFVKTYHPAMLLVVRGANGPTTFHRIYLNGKGGKADVEIPKKLASGTELLKGHYVDVCSGTDETRTIAVGEGYETMATVAVAHGYQIKVRSYLNANELSRAQQISVDLYDRVIIYADHDRLCKQRNVRPGEYAARQLEAKLLQEGFSPSQIEVRLPKQEKTDWNDVWQHAANLLGNFLGKLAYRCYATKSDDPFNVIEEMVKEKTGV